MTAKKKTPTEKYIDQAVKQALKAGQDSGAVHDVTIKDCHLGVKYTEETINAVEAIASALEVNAASLGQLARAINGSNYCQSEPYLHIGDKK